MEEQRKNMFFDLCRLCLVERGYCNISDRNKLFSDIYKCTGVKVYTSNDLPQKICKVCLDTVDKIIEFRNITRKNDKHLRDIFDQSENDMSLESETESPNKKNMQSVEETKRNKCSISVRKDLFNTSESKSPVKLKDDAGSTLNLVLSMKPKNGIGDTDTEYKCPVCKKNFSKWRKLYGHHRLHNKCYKCPTDCGKKFATKGDLEKHIRTHTGEKPYMCNECDKCFAQRGSLKAHKESMHTKSCELLGK